MTTTTTSKANGKARDRKAHVEPCGVLVLTIESKEYLYHLTPLRSDFGACFELTKFKAQGGETYHVCIYPDGKHHTCECKGFLRWGKPCKHISALAALLKAGRMPAFIPV